MKTRPLAGLAAMTAAALLVMTRVPFGETGVDILLALAGVGVATVASMDLVGRRYDRSSSAQVVALLVLLVVPTSQDAILSWVPHWLVAVVTVVAVYAVSLRDELVAPAVQLDRKGAVRRSQIGRSLPLVAAVAIVIAIPYTYTWLAAPRFADVHAWEGAMRVTVPLLVVAGGVAGVAFLRPRRPGPGKPTGRPLEVEL